MIQHTLEITGLPPFTMGLHPLNADQAVSTYIYHFGCWEPFETVVFQRLIDHFKMFVDLGANIGWYTVLAEMLMKEGSEVHSFEPDPDNFDLLSYNADRPTRAAVRLNKLAVAERVGEGKLFRSSNNYGDHQLYSTSEARDAIGVPVTTLDTYFAARRLPPLLAKMDTQGSELRIMKGGGSIFSTASEQNAYMVEFWPLGVTNAGSQVGEFIDFLERLPQAPYAIMQNEKKLKLMSWSDLRRQAGPGGGLSPPTQQFIDLVMITPGTTAFEAVADLILSE